MNRITPLTGCVLVELVPPATITPGGIAIPQRHKSADEVQEENHHPKPPPADEAVVVAIGPWSTLPNGMAEMPEFGVGAHVAIGYYAGKELADPAAPQRRLKLLPIRDVLAVLA